uniref:Beta-xylanase n=1 Tax=uncultured bacterium contig00063 TaxID=1181546 RepID=A0A806JZ03_9BACT|nr:endo-1,4-beta-xylanase A precursor [uncultured bacterium contig00063]
MDFSLLTTSITYTGIESSLASDFAALKTKFVNNGVPVIIGESGPARYENWSGNTGYSPENAATHRANRLTFIDLLFGTARANGIVPVYWENGIFPDFEYRSEGDFSLIDRVTGQPNSPESAEVIQRMVDAVNNSPPPPPTPPAIGGNLDNYVFGTGEHGETVYTQAVWSLTGTNLTTAQAAGTKLVLRLSQAPNAALQLVWQGPANELWWKQTDILGPTGDILNAGNATWNSVTNTLTINLSAAADYSTFTAQPDLNLIIAYYGGDSVNDLGIISVNLVSGDVPTPPTTITGNLGNYRFGTDDGVNYTNYNQAVWELTSPQVTTAQTAGTKLVLQLSQAPADSLDFVWQGPTNAAGDPSLWWKQTDILGPTGDILNASYATWNSGTSTLIINLSAAADYSTFTSQPDLNLIIVYHGGDSVNDLGIVSASLTGGEAANPAPSYPPSTPSITTVATPLYSKWPFHVGAAVPGWGVYPYSVDGNAIDSNSQQFPLLDHFKVYVAENDMKPESIMPSQWQSWYNSNNPLPYDAAHPYRWTNSDALLHIAEKNGKDVRGHVLIWHAQTPEVFFRTGDKDSALVSKEVLYQRMEQHIKTVFERYGGRIKWWDVVNESVGDSGGPRPGGDPASGGSRYTEIMESSGATGNDRYEYILKSFQWARQYADANGGHDVKLYLTDYNIEYSGAKQTEFLNLLDYLITNNAPIDGVGMQSHISIHWPTVTEFSNAIDQFTARVRGGKNLTVQICELDISVFAYNDTRAELPPEELTPALSTLAQLYRDLFDTFYDKYLANKLEMVLVWGLSDAHSWLNDRLNKTRVDHCLLFDRSYQPKEAFNRLITGPVAPPPPVAFTDSKTMVDSAPVFTAPASGDPGTINGDGTITLVGTQVVDYLFPGIPVADANNTNNIATISEFDYFVIQYSGVTYTGAGNQTEVRWRQIGTGAGGTEFAPHGGNQYPQLNDGNTIPNGNTRFDVSSITNAGIAISGTANTNFTFKVDSVTFYVAEKITINFVADDVSIGYTYGGTTLSPIVDAKVLHPIGALPTISASDYPAGYTFGGWQFGTTPVTATTRVAANTWTMLTAKWNPVRSPETYYLNLGISNVVTSNSTGGSLVNSATNDTDGYLVLNYTANDQRALIGLNGRLNNPDSGEYITIGSALQAAASITLSITATTNDGGANYRVIIGRNAGSDWAWSETSVDNKNLAGGIIGQAFTTKNNQPSPPGSEIWDPTVLILQSRAAVTHTYTISEIKFELTF